MSDLRKRWTGSLFLLALFPAFATAATWYWRPNNGSYGRETGTSYANAWSRESQISWSRMKDGDTLLVCGRHNTGYDDRQISSGRANVIISGNCPGDPGEIVSVGTRLKPKDWQGPDAAGVYKATYSGSPGIARDEIGGLRRLESVPDTASPCRSYFHEAGTFFYRPCGELVDVYPGGGAPVVGIRHDGVTVEHLAISNGGRAVEVENARGVTLRHLRIGNHSAHGITLAGSTSNGRIQFNEIHDVTDGIITLAGGPGGGGSGNRHDGWLVEANVIHDVYGSGDSHAIGWASGSDNVFRRNFIYRVAGSGITIYAWKHQENSRNVIEENVILDVVKRSIEQNQRGIELSGDSCWPSLDIRRGDVIRGNIVDNVAEGIYAKAGPAAGLIIEGNRIRARKTGIRWASPNGGRIADLPPGLNVVEAPQRLQPVFSPPLDCR